MKNLSAIYWVIGVLAGVGLILWVATSSPSAPKVSSDAAQILTVKPEDWKKGPDTAKAVLVEYGDFQCPACRSYKPVIDQLLNDFPNDLQVVYRHFPLRSIHRNADISARAAEAAGKQGKFWEMYDMLYTLQTEWSTLGDPDQKFADYGSRIGLNVDQLRSDWGSAVVKGLVDAEYQEAINLGLNSTPTFFLNGKKIQAPGTYDEFKQLIEKQIAA